MKLLHVEGNEAAAKSFANLARAQTTIAWQIRHVNDAYEGIDYLSGFKRSRISSQQIGVIPIIQK
jgi:hypothetical protein